KVSSKYCVRCGSCLTPPLPVSEPTQAGRVAGWRADPQATRPAPVSKDGGPDVELRQMTVLFCDLVGSTALGEHLDPEALVEVVQAYQGMCAEVIERCGGQIAQYLGDGVLAWFGASLRDEAAAESAVRAGLGILEGLPALNTRLQREMRIRLAVRIG